MKKLLCMMLVFCLLVPAMASAERTVVTALAITVNPDNLASVAVDARITDYNQTDNALTIELLVPELFDFNDIENLNIGDAIYTQGREIEIREIEEDGGYVVLNPGQDGDGDDTVWLCQYLDQNYTVMNQDDAAWIVLATVTVPVPDRLLFLDEIEEVTLMPLYVPAVHGRSDFLSAMEAEKENGPGFAANNAMVVFDENGDLALIRRYYVPWQ